MYLLEYLFLFLSFNFASAQCAFSCFFVILFQVISLSLPAGFHWSQKLTDGPKNLNKLIHTSVFKCLIL